MKEDSVGLLEGEQSFIMEEKGQSMSVDYVETRRSVEMLARVIQDENDVRLNHVERNSFE